MTAEDLRWMIGIALAIIGSVGGIAVGAFRAMSRRLDDAMTRLTDKILAGDRELHGRADRLRQDMSDNYVRRVDLDGHMARMDATLKEMRDDQKEMMKQLAGISASPAPAPRRRPTARKKPGG